MAHPTTIQVEKKTLHLLKQLKGRFKVKTYDELIRKMVSQSSSPKSYFGAFPGISSFTEEDKLKFHDEE